jgi:hypothetical protein
VPGALAEGNARVVDGAVGVRAVTPPHEVTMKAAATTEVKT